MNTGWPAYFDGLGEQSPLHREQAALYVVALRDQVGLRREQRVLDFGCGFGFVAALLAPLVAEVWVWDPAPNMRAVTAHRTAELANVRLCDLSAEPAPEVAVEAAPFDLILVNSVAQYMAPEDLSAWLPRWRAMLARGGAVVLSDLIPPRHSGLSDVSDLLRLGARHGSPLRGARAAVGGIRRYWRTSRAAPLVRVGHDDLDRRAAEADLEVTALPRNLTHFRRRWTAVLQPP